MNYHLARVLIVLFASIPVNLLVHMAIGAKGFWVGVLVGFVSFMFADIWYGSRESRDDRS